MNSIINIFWGLGAVLGIIPWSSILNLINDEAGFVGLGLQFAGIIVLLVDLVIKMTVG